MSRDLEACLGATYHSPLPLETERHHIFPMFMSELLGIPIVRELVPLCPTEHVNVHHAIEHLLLDGTPGGHRFADRTQTYIDRCWTWWTLTLLAGVV